MAVVLLEYSWMTDLESFLLYVDRCMGECVCAVVRIDVVCMVVVLFCTESRRHLCEEVWQILDVVPGGDHDGLFGAVLVGGLVYCMGR